VTLLTSTIVIAGLYTPFANALTAVKKSGRISVLTVATGILNIGMNLILIPWIGIVGAALSMMISYAALLILSWIQARRYFAPFPGMAHLAGTVVVLGLCVLLAWWWESART
jgi:O-antigen/teichoic acid export membrane protein